MKNIEIIILGIIVFIILFSMTQTKKEGPFGLKVHYYNDGIEVFPKNFPGGIFSIVTPPGIDVDQISFEIIGSNADSPITNMQIEDAYPQVFKDALPTTIQTLNPGETKTLWTSGLIDTAPLESPDPVTFWINVSGEVDFGGTIIKTSQDNSIDLLIQQPSEPKELIAHWSFEGNADDSTGSNDGTLINSPTFTDGINGQAIVLSNNKYVKVDSTQISNIDSGITISAWVNTNYNDQDQIIAMSGYRPGFWFFATDEANKGFDIHISDSDATGAGYQVMALTPEILENKWYHVTFAFDGSTLSIYLDGVLVKSANTTGIVSNTSRPGSPFYIGSWYGSSLFFNGMIDEMSVWNYALTEQEIYNDYLNNIPDYILFRTTSLTYGIGETIAYSDTCGNELEIYKEDSSDESTGDCMNNCDDCESLLFNVVGGIVGTDGASLYKSKYITNGIVICDSNDDGKARSITYTKNTGTISTSPFEENPAYEVKCYGGGRT